MDISIVTERPDRVLGFLSEQLKAVEDMIQKLDEHMVRTQEQLGAMTSERIGLTLVHQAIENDMDRIRSCAPHEPEQLELDLGE